MADRNPFTNFEARPLPADLHHWRNGFDSRFLRFFALNGKPRVCTIKDVGLLDSSDAKGKETKRQLLITLAEFEKPWAANVTNCETIGTLYGDDPAGWVGKRVTLYPTKTKFGRETVDCIRVRDQIPADTQTQREPAQTQRQPMRPEVASYLQSMADAATGAALDAVQEALVNDNSLDEKETGLLARALGKRRTQLNESQAGPG